MHLKQQFLKNKLYNHLMSNGKKYVCENLLLKTFKAVQKSKKKNHKTLIQTLIINSAPIIQMKQIKKKKRKTTKEFPFILNKKNRITLSIKSILSVLNQTKKIGFFYKFSDEILTNSKDKNNILKIKETKHIQALTKKKFIFFRWFC